jgi:hypothetical protein
MIIPARIKPLDEWTCETCGIGRTTFMENLPGMPIRFDTTMRRSDHSRSSRAWLATCESTYRVFMGTDAASEAELAELLGHTRLEVCERDIEIPWIARAEWKTRLWLQRLGFKCSAHCYEAPSKLPLHLRFLRSCFGDCLCGLAKSIKVCCIWHFIKNQWWRTYRGGSMPHCNYWEEPGWVWPSVPDPPEFCYAPCRKHWGAAMYPVIVLEDS